MQDHDPIYDVAISFLYQDLALAQALYAELCKSLTLFFFPRNQEELAGSDGLESMRAPFRSQSRINVVLYRPKWGNTPWTGVEEVAVKESCLATSFKSIFFLVIEPIHELPKWLPETHVRFNLADFTLEQAVGAIKARVQERGGHFKPMTPLRKAESLQIEENYQRDRRQINSAEGIRKVFENVGSLFAEITAQLEDVNENGNLSIEHQIQLRFGTVEQSCLLGMSRVGMGIYWVQHSNLLDEAAALVIREFNENAIVPKGHMRLNQLEVLKDERYNPDVSRTREYVWTPRRNDGGMISSKDLATEVVLQFLELVERDRAGKIKRKGWH